MERPGKKRRANRCGDTCPPHDEHIYTQLPHSGSFQADCPNNQKHFTFKSFAHKLTVKWGEVSNTTKHF